MTLERKVLKAPFPPIEVSVDEHGRLSLTDIHKALSGGSRRLEPSQWLTTHSAKEVIGELDDDETEVPPVVSSRGKGTFATYKVAVSYAMDLDSRVLKLAAHIYADLQLIGYVTEEHCQALVPEYFQ